MEACDLPGYASEYLYIRDSLYWLRVTLPVVTHLAMLLPIAYLVSYRKRYTVDFYFEFVYLLTAMYFSIGYHITAGVNSTHPMFDKNLYAFADSVISPGLVALLPGLFLYYTDRFKRNRLSFVLVCGNLVASFLVLYYPAMAIAAGLAIAHPLVPGKFALWAHLLPLALIAGAAATFYLLSDGVYGFLWHSAWHIAAAVLVWFTLCVLEKANAVELPTRPPIFLN